MLAKFHETLGCRKSIEELNSKEEKKLHFLKLNIFLKKYEIIDKSLDSGY